MNELFNFKQNIESCSNFEGMKTSKIFDIYWYFASERQKIFYKKIENQNWPWTADHILQTYKFTNVYRASDRVSQYLIKSVIYNNNYAPDDTIFRILLFKIFNKIETWQKLENQFGEITYKSFNYQKYCEYLDKLLSENTKIYSAAYIMPSGLTTFKNRQKHRNNLSLLEYMFSNGLVKNISKADSLRHLYELLLSYPTLGKFLAFQYAIDINYSEICDFDEMSFVVAGPGAIRGINKCFPNCTLEPELIIKLVAENQVNEFCKRKLNFARIGNRPLQLIDCQNIFCEIDKYSRVSNPELSEGAERIKQKYKYESKPKIEYFYPPKWHVY